jgi:hypothetical protein
MRRLWLLWGEEEVLQRQILQREVGRQGFNRCATRMRHCLCGKFDEAKIKEIDGNSEWNCNCGAGENATLQHCNIATLQHCTIAAMADQIETITCRHFSTIYQMIAAI